VRRPVLAGTTACVVPVALGGLWVGLVGGWVARTAVVLAGLVFLLDVVWLADEWVKEWQREGWRQWLARTDPVQALWPCVECGRPARLGVARCEACRLRCPLCGGPTRRRDSGLWECEAESADTRCPGRVV
jgi:hypothetical protein